MVENMVDKEKEIVQGRRKKIKIKNKNWALTNVSGMCDDAFKVP
jgi:hypothetical protein